MIAAQNYKILTPPANMHICAYFTTCAHFVHSTYVLIDFMYVHIITNINSHDFCYFVIAESLVTKFILVC